MAHSAGAPYALSFANKVPERIRGEIFLLAPWVGGVEGGLCCLLRIASYFVSLYLTSRLQMAQVCADWYTKDRSGCRMENAGLDARETSNSRLQGYWLRCQICELNTYASITR